MGKLTLLLLALLVWLQYSLWFGKNGLHDYSRVNDDVTAQQATNAKLKARNDQLFAEIDDLNGGQEAIEERARNELSMTRPGETFYRLVPDASKRNHRGNSRTIDKQAQDYDMAATFPGVCAVVPAAGFGRRMQTECPKQYLSIGNKTILEHAVAALLAIRVQRVVIAVSPATALQPAAAGHHSANYRR
jgi:cell division protein FtsB